MRRGKEMGKRNRGIGKGRDEENKKGGEAGRREWAKRKGELRGN